MVGALALLLLMVVVIFMGTTVQAHVSISVVQPTPIVDLTATVAVLNTEKLVGDVEQQQHTLGNWLWSNAAALLSSLVLAIAGVFTLFRYLRDQRSEREKQREEREKQEKDRQVEEQRQRGDRQAELEKRAEERFQSAVTGLGDEKEGAQVGAAILLRTFLRPGYEQFHIQTFDLAVANLRRRGVSKIVQCRLWDAPMDSNIVSPLTALDQALIMVFKKAFPLARCQEREPASLDVTGIQLNNAYLAEADLKQMWGSQVSLQKANLGGADLSGANLTEARLSGAFLHRAKLINTFLFGADLSEAFLNEACLVNADLAEAVLIDADLNGANLINASLTGAYLTGTCFANADLSGADLTNADLRGADLRGAHLSGATLNGAKLNSADLSGATLDSAKLIMADLSGAHLITTIFREAILREATLRAYPNNRIKWLLD